MKNMPGMAKGGKSKKVSMPKGGAKRTSGSLSKLKKMK